MDKPQPKGGKLARSAVMLCKNPEFCLYLDRRQRYKFSANVPDGTHTEQDAKDFITRACGVTSRAELDHSPQAANNFRYIYGIFRKYQQHEPSPGGR